MQCASNMSASQKTQTKKKEAGKLVAWAAKRLEERYAEANTDCSLSDLMAALQITPS